MSSAGDLLRVADRVALGELVGEYARCVDRVQLELVVGLFTADGVLAVHADGEQAPATAVRTGREEILAALESLRRYEITAHHVGQQLVRFAPSPAGAPQRATGEVYCTGHHVRVRHGQRTDRVLMLRYLDDYVVDGGRWQFARRRVCTDITDERVLPG